MDFDAAFDALIGNEGGYVDDPNDPGGATRYGVTVRVARAHGYTGPMEQLPLDMAKEIAKAEYWTPAHCDDVPDGLRFDIFDTAYNTGVHEAIVLLQRAMGLQADGYFGPATQEAIAGHGFEWLRRAFNAERLDFYTNLPGWLHDGRGWTKRVAANLRRL